MGYINNVFPSENAKIDVLRVANYLALFSIPILLSNNNFFRKENVFKIFGYISFTFVLLVGISLFTVGGGKSIFFGNLFGATTVNLSVVSLLVIAGLQYYYRYNGKLGLYIATLGYIITVASLAKWNFVVILFTPYLIYKILAEKTKSNAFTRINLFIGSGILVFFLFLAKDKILNSFASINQFDDIESYFNSRVLRTKTDNSSIESGVLLIEGDVGIKDGARFMIWMDLINKTMDSPFFGIGLGTRAGNNAKIDIEDHSIFIFFLSRFGFILFLLFFYKVYKLYKIYYKIIENPKYKLSKLLLTLLLLNFYFQASVGNIWGQILYVLMLGLIVHFYFFRLQILPVKKRVLK